MFAAVVHAVCLAPLVRLIWLGAHAGLSANPVEFVTHATGDAALNLLLATLCLTPLAKLSGSTRWTKARRAVGLYAFFYACLHFTIWLWLDKEFSLREMSEDVVKRSFITAGFAALVLMVPLAATSTNWAIRKLGKRWGKLHRLVYASATLGVIHYIWLVKIDRRWPYAYLAALSLLLGWRIWSSYNRDRPGWTRP